MRANTRIWGWLVALLLLSASAPRPAFADDSDAAGVAHFKSGVGLFRDGNYAGALAEFEESYRLRPGASALQNIALCQRQLFRYAAAIGSLEKMLKSYGPALSADDKLAAETALKELRERVTKVTLEVTPKNAAVLIDGKAVEGNDDGSRRLVLDVGEHNVVASAPGFEDREMRISVAGTEKTIEVKLSAATASLQVATDDVDATIFVDGIQVGKGSWSGALAAGDRHFVKVEKEGRAPAVAEVVLKVDEAKTLNLPPGPALLDSAKITPGTAVPGTGFYGFVTGSLYLLNQHPDGYRTPKNRGESAGYFGARFGYRLTPRWGLEVVAEGGKHTVGPGCYRYPDQTCDTATPANPIYDLTAYRLGLGGRYFGKGTSVRFIATGALGLAYHAFRIDAQEGTPEGTRAPASGDDSAPNAFFLSELGAEIPIGRALVDIVGVASIDGMSNLRVNDKACKQQDPPCDYAVYNGNKTVAMVGLGIRIGYGRW
jgi:hypothetical protein